ncbi:hypothetical protein F0249_19850 [Vibrio sp. 03-59-1]|uniref:hypothetical protein n=1 Tax=Vibrio sp. 03-59-1 TaxID=2607607 RepID=UPI0014935E55|nr:hypothetical protein [Vibrio sp. 03-59-1]NOH86026.1 hypothetical protein [Vibrio sp. 03-59-1]
MKNQMFEHWQKVREQGFLAWIFKSCFLITTFYIIFNVLLQYSSSSAETLFEYLSEQVLNYFVFSAFMFFVYWGIWLHRESKYQKESQRRNVT